MLEEVPAEDDEPLPLEDVEDAVVEVEEEPSEPSRVAALSPPLSPPLSRPCHRAPAGTLAELPARESVR